MSISLPFITIFLSISITIEQQLPFQLTVDYHVQQMMKTNFMITTQLQRQSSVPIDCESNRNRLCLVELALQIQTDSMSVEISCQPPAFPYANFYANQSVHTCLLPARNAIEEPTIHMIVNAHEIGVVQTWATANFSYSSQYNIVERGETPIDIVASREESVLTRSIRAMADEDNDDAVESEGEEEECTTIRSSFNNGK